MFNTDKKQISIKLNLSADMNRLAKIIEKKGGNFWNKKGNRAYFPDNVDDIYTIESKVPAPFDDVFVDLDTKELIFSMDSEDAEKYFDEAVYKKELIDFLKK